MHKFYKVLIVFCILLMGCNQGSNDVASLQQIVRDQQSQLNDLNNRVTALSATCISLALQNFAAKSASFTPADVGQGFQVVNTNAGQFLVLLDSVNRYANGYKVTFSIGNPNLAIFEGTKLVIHWGKPLEKNDSYLDWHKNLSSQQQTITNKIYPGVWNKVSFVLSPANAQDIGYIDLSLTVDSVLLNKDFRK